MKNHWVKATIVGLFVWSGVGAWLVAGDPPKKLELRSAEGELNKLNWMVGSWASKSGGRSSEEHWTHADGDTMFGVSRTISGGKTTMFEYLQIVNGPQEIAYLSSPGGRHPPTVFKAVKIEDRRVVFENPKHDFPQRIIYWRDTDGTLHARIEGSEGGKEKGSEWSWQPAVVVGQ